MSDIENYIAPGSVEAAAQALADGDVTIMAGGTDLMLQGQNGAVTYQPTLMNINRVDGLRGVSVNSGTIHIGALTTITDLLEDSIIAEKLPVLAAMANKFASNQIRNAATVGGNVINASPAGDSIVPLLVLNAEAVLSSTPNGSVETRTVPLQEFFTGPGKTIKQANELLVAIDVPVPISGFVAGFRKFGSRPALEISMAAGAIGGVVENGALTDVRVAFGAVGPTPMRARQTEAAIEGKSLNEETIKAAGAIAKKEVTPITDVRASEWYRRHLVGVMTEEILEDVV